jgi:hypothetical protein
MTCGFTGTQRGMAPRQLKAVRQLLGRVKVLHLGDCVGADVEAYQEARSLGIACIGHPPSERIKRALCRYDEERAPRSYLLRNRDIAQEGVDGLIAAPKEFVEARRSGTWATVRVARKLGRRIWIVLPDGKVKQEPAQQLASICYVDHATGYEDHMNAHVRTSKCEDGHGA